MHVIKLDGYNATVDNGEKLELGTFCSYGEEQLQIVKAPDWGNFSIIATFNPPYKKPVQAVVDSVTGVIKVPKEATADSYGVGTIVFVGLADGVQRISSDVEYIVRRHSNASGTEPAEPTPDLLQQVLTLSKDAQTAAKNAEQSAKNAAKDAADTVKPYKEEAVRAATAAALSEKNAAESKTAAQEAAERATQAGIAASNAAEEAERSAGIATDAAGGSALNAENAHKSALAAQQSANNAAESQSAAAASADAAAKSHQSAAIDAKTASDAKVAAAGSAEAAAGSANAAENSASAAAGSEQAAGTSELKAAKSEKAAKASEQAASESEANAKQSADTLAESVENVAANTAAVAELKKKKAEIDDAAVGANAWSSKHIVDMLCPPLEESGNPVVCYPVAGYPLGVKAKWEPMQEGTGTPSPENIRPIKGRDSVNVERCGENLLPFGERIENIYKQQLMTSDDLLLLSKACAGQELTLTFSVETKNIVFGDTVEDEWRKRIGFECHGTLADGTEVYVLQCWIDDTNGELTQNGKKTKTLTVTMPKLASGDIVFYAQNIKSGSFVAYDFGIYAGTTAPTTYTPYNGQTNTLTLPETVYGGEVDAVRGNGNNNTKIITLDGTERWIMGSSVEGIHSFYVPSAVTDMPIATTTTEVCTHYKISNYNDGTESAFLSGEPYAYINTGRFNSVEGLKSYLAAQHAAGTPVQIAYKLAEPVLFTATGAQALPALAGMNTVLTDADSATVTGRADPIKRITDLEAAVASIN